MANETQAPVQSQAQPPAQPPGFDFGFAPNTPAPNTPAAQDTAPAQTAPSSGFDFQFAGKQEQEGSGRQEQKGDFGSDAFAKHPILTQLHRGFETGVLHGFGLTAPNPEDPHSIGISDMASQTWNNLKQGAIHSYHALGGTAPGEEKWEKAPIYRLDIPVVSALATVATPVDMIGSGIESMVTTIEDGSKEMR